MWKQSNFSFPSSFHQSLTAKQPLAAGMIMTRLTARLNFFTYGNVTNTCSFMMSHLTSIPDGMKDSWVAHTYLTTLQPPKSRSPNIPSSPSEHTVEHSQRPLNNSNHIIWTLDYSIGPGNRTQSLLRLLSRNMSNQYAVLDSCPSYEKLGKTHSDEAYLPVFHGSRTIFPSPASLIMACDQRPDLSLVPGMFGFI